MDDPEGEDVGPFKRLLEDIQFNSVDTVVLCNALGNEEVKCLAEVFRNNRSVRTLQMQGALLDGTGEKLTALAPALRNDNITDLDLSGNNIDPDAMAVLAASLRGSSVQCLDLGWNGLGDQGAVALADALTSMSVTDLSIAGNEIGEEGATALAVALETSCVAGLNLGNNLPRELGLKALANALAVNSVLKLELDHSEIEDDGVKILAIALKHSRLKVLVLARNLIYDEGVKALAAGICDSPLTDLDLSHNHIGNHGAIAMAAAVKNSNLEILVLHSNGIGVEGLRAFLEGSRDSALTCLSLEGPQSERTPQVVEVLQQVKEVIQENKTRTLLLQMQVEGDETEWHFTFRTMAGTVAAVLNWNSDRPAKDLPEAVFLAMRASGVELPTQHLRPRNLRIVKADGTMLDVSDGAASLAQQLAKQ